MPRFDEEAVKVLKQKMIKRLPECYFTQVDIDELMTETGLNAAQIMQWSDNLRFRIPVQTDREATLHGDESSTKVT